jgi:hypothetical protein
VLAVIAGIIFIAEAILGWTDKAISVAHLIAVLAVGLAFLAAHLAFRLWGPTGRW